MENVLDSKIGNYIKMFVIGLFAILFIYIVYDNHTSKQQIKVSTKTKDSLEALLLKYESDYVELKNKADKLDSIIKVKTDSVLIIKKTFYVYRDKEIKNPDEATKYIKNFLNE
jgi:hypothetical protein